MQANAPRHRKQWTDNQRKTEGQHITAVTVAQLIPKKSAILKNNCYAIWCVIGTTNYFRCVTLHKTSEIENC